LGSIQWWWTTPSRSSILAIKRWGKMMPKFYHGEQLGFAYKARATGWHRIFPLSLLPYLTGDEIYIHVSLKPLCEGQAWQQGTIGIDTPVLYRSDSQTAMSNWVFPFVEFREWPKEISTPPKYQFPTNKWWSRTLPLKGGGRFGQSCNIECGLSFQNFEDGVEETAPIHIADIEVVSRGPFLTQLYMWGFTTAVAIGAFLLALFH